MKLLRGVFIGYVPNLDATTMRLIWPLILGQRNLTQVYDTMFRVTEHFESWKG